MFFLLTIKGHQISTFSPFTGFFLLPSLALSHENEERKENKYIFLEKPTKKKQTDGRFSFRFFFFERRNFFSRPRFSLFPAIVHHVQRIFVGFTEFIGFYLVLLGFTEFY